MIEEDEDERVLTASPHHQEELGVAEEVRKEAQITGSLEDEMIQKKQENTTGKEKANIEGTDWSLVSPTKTGRSPVRLANTNQSEDFQITASKFAVIRGD